MNSYKLSDEEKDILYSFCEDVVTNQYYNFLFKNSTNGYYQDTIDKIFKIILPNANVKVIYHPHNEYDITINFNSNKNLTLFLLTKEDFIENLFNSNYNALGLQ